MPDALFTPGPWLVHDWMGSGDFHWIVPADQPDFRVAKVEAFAPTDGDMEAQGIANAHLIAASPSLYAVAELALELLEANLSQLLESHCLLDGQLQPIRDTLEDDAKTEVLRLEAAIADARAILAKACGEQPEMADA